LLGEVGVLAGTPRSATAVAHTDVRLRRFSKDSLDQLTRDDPQAGVSVAWALGRDAASKLLASSQRVAEHLAGEGTDPAIDQMVAAAADAQRQFESWPEEAVDALLADIARAIGDRAERLAEATFAETGVGNVRDKALKIRFGSVGVQAAIVNGCSSWPARSESSSP
jgi:CRP-like cAMP-binding protein